VQEDFIAAAVAFKRVVALLRMRSTLTIQSKGHGGYRLNTDGGNDPWQPVFHPWLMPPCDSRASCTY